MLMIKIKDYTIMQFYKLYKTIIQKVSEHVFDQYNRLIVFTLSIYVFPLGDNILNFKRIYYILY